jgi:ParB family transcriptional regulator, chromosome partitioning protein
VPIGRGPDPGSRMGAELLGAELLSVAVGAIRPNGFQPRQEFEEKELDELAASIREVGVLQPILVRRIEEGRYELVAGERRWRAAQRAGLTEVPALVRQVTDKESLEQAVVENLHRSDLNVLEEAAAYRQLVDEFLLTQEDVALRVGRSRAAVANTIRLLQLPGLVQGHIRSGSLGAGHARALLVLSDQHQQVALAERVVRDGLSVREVEKLVRAAGQRRVGADDDKGAPAERAASKPASALELERLLADRLATRVTVSLSGSGGRLVIEFADLDDLGRVYQAMTTPEGESAVDW